MRLLQAAGALLAVTSCIFLAAGGFGVSEMTRVGELRRTALIDAEESGAIDAERTPVEDTYCSVFSDPEGE